MASITEKENITTGADSEEVLVQELRACRPIFWFELPAGPERDALRLVQEKPQLNR